jgi:hypothetical protein
MAGEGEYLIGYAEYAESVMRSLGLKGDLPRSVQSDYGLGIQLADLSAPEFQYLKRAVLWESGATQAAVAGELGMIVLASRLLATSRTVMAVIEKINISNIGAAAATFAVGVDWNALTTFASINRSSYPRDDRAALVSTSAFATGSDSDPASIMGSSHFSVTLAINQVYDLEGPWVITNKPNAAGLFSFFGIQCSSPVNNAFRAAIMWRERELHDTEL